MFEVIFRRHRLAAAVIIASAAIAQAAPAQATQAYDGAWSLTFVTNAGDCDPSYNFGINVVDGRISHPNLVRFRGHVTAKGYARASVAVGNKYASGTGRLAASSGGGNWSGFSGTSRCSGRWTATRL